MLGGWAQGVTCSEGGGGFAEGSGEDPLTTVIRLQRCGEEPGPEAVLSPGLPLAGGRAQEGTLQGEGAAGNVRTLPVAAGHAPHT